MPRFRSIVTTSSLPDNGAVELQVSGDGGATWTTLQSYSSANLVGSGTDSFDITDYASPNTQIRFYVTSSQNAFYYIYFDDVQIEYAVASAYVSAVRADQVSLTGNDVTVAVIDSGIAYHNDFDITGSRRSRIEMNEYFTGSGGSEDLYGHGTHVAGIIAGNGKMSNGEYQGIATEVGLINLKVADKDGMTYESDVIEAFEWVYNHKSEYNIRVVNLSMNSSVAQSYHTSPLSAAVEILWFNGIVMVVSAGNNGTGEVPSPLPARQRSLCDHGRRNGRQRHSRSWRRQPGGLLRLWHHRRRLFQTRPGRSRTQPDRPVG